MKTPLMEAIEQLHVQKLQAIERLVQHVALKAYGLTAEDLMEMGKTGKLMATCRSGLDTDPVHYWLLDMKPGRTQHERAAWLYTVEVVYMDPFGSLDLSVIGYRPELSIHYTTCLPEDVPMEILLGK